MNKCLITWLLNKISIYSKRKAEDNSSASEPKKSVALCTLLLCVFPKDPGIAYEREFIPRKLINGSRIRGTMDDMDTGRILFVLGQVSGEEIPVKNDLGEQRGIIII